MAMRTVFGVDFKRPFYNEVEIEFVWNKGLNINQARKNVVAVHEAYSRLFPEKRILEISSKSLQPEGMLLSAFKLQKYVPTLDKSLAVENIYQGGKIFETGGPFWIFMIVQQDRRKKTGDYIRLEMLSDSILRQKHIHRSYMILSIIGFT